MLRTDFADVDILRTMFQDQTWVVRANTTGYLVGDRVFNSTSAFDGNIYECVVAGTSGGAPPTWQTTLGQTTTDGSVTWLTCKMGMPKRALYVALFLTSNPPTDAGGGTEVSGGSYTRVTYAPTNANWTAPNAAGNLSNKVAITFPAPTADWGNVGWFGIFDRLAGGNLYWYGQLTDAFDVLNGATAPSFPIGALQVLDKQFRVPSLRTTIP